MIDSLRGELVYKSPTYIRVDVNGVGYGLCIPVSTYNALESVGEGTSLLTYLYVREDTMRLYGFRTEEEMEAFKLLMSVTKIGPQLALGILSSLSVEELKKAIIDDDVSKLNGISGVGKKTAQRIIIELKEKIAPAEMVEIPGGVVSTEEASLMQEGVRALMSLGCSKKEAITAIRTACEHFEDKDMTIEELVKHALKQL